MPRITTPKNIPKLGLQQFHIASFKGVDYSNAPANVKEYRSPDAPNMIPDLAGKPVKRTGYHEIARYPGRINGVFYLRLETQVRRVVHAGDKLYDGAQMVYSAMADTRSTAWQVGGKLWILDGLRYLVFGEFENPDYDEVDPESAKTVFACKPVEEIAYVPMITAARPPSGGGEIIYPKNLICSRWTDSFYGLEGESVFQLSYAGLDDTPVTAKKLDSDANWVELAEGTDFTVDRESGRVTFVTPPGKSPVDGADNVQITASKENSAYANRINHCDISMLFGVSGASDRLFVSGNAEFPHYDWYSQKDDPSYFGDQWYSVLGQDSSRIMGYSIVADQLVTHKDRAENGSNVIVRRGQLMDGKAAFPIVSALQGEGAISKRAFGYLSNEPLFLTSLGIYAITAQDITGEKYTQNRSFYINKRLSAESNLAEAVATVYQNFYLLAADDTLYILDSDQRSYEANAPYATFQYECYVWENIPARTLWEWDDTLMFGTENGQIMQFYKDFENNLSFYDDALLLEPWDGEVKLEGDGSFSQNEKCAINAHWDLPEFDGKNFYASKTVRRVAIKLASAAVTSVTVMAQIRGAWKLLFAQMSKARYFAFSKLTFSKFTFLVDTTPRTIIENCKIKQVDKTRLRLENAEPGEPFGIFDLALEFTEKGVYKG